LFFLQEGSTKGKTGLKQKGGNKRELKNGVNEEKNFKGKTWTEGKSVLENRAGWENNKKNWVYGGDSFAFESVRMEGARLKTCEGKKQCKKRERHTQKGDAGARK